MIASVALRAYYQPHCHTCMEEVEQTVASAIRDQSVTSVSLVASKKCEHDALARPLLAQRSAPTSPTSRGKINTPTPPTSSDTDNEAAGEGNLFIVEPLPDPLNGFDPHIRSG